MFWFIHVYTYIYILWRGIQVYMCKAEDSTQGILFGGKYFDAISYDTRTARELPSKGNAQVKHGPGLID